MEKISPQLQNWIESAGPASFQPLKIIVTLNPGADWSASLQQLKEAGLIISAEEEPIRAVSGEASSAAIRKMAALDGVALIESDAMAKATHQ